MVFEAVMVASKPFVIEIKKYTLFPMFYYALHEVKQNMSKGIKIVSLTLDS